MDELPPWRVLLLCVGRGAEFVRAELRGFAEELGFEVSVYDNPGYPANPALDTVSACVDAIDQHDIVIALVDEEEGTPVDPGSLDPGTRDYLTEHDLLPPASPALPPPTILQLEVETARHRGKPTLVLMTTGAKEAQRQLLKLLAEGGLSLEARRAGARPPMDLVDSDDLAGLAEDYDVPSGNLASFRHVLFIRRLENAGWVRYWDRGKPEQLRDQAKSALATIPLALVCSGVQQAHRRLETARPPLGGTPSLRDLLSANLILAPPYRVLSGDPGSGELYSPDDELGRLRDWLLAGRSVFLRGHPGLGKSTLTMLVHPSLDVTTTSGPPLGVLWGSWRDLVTVPDTWESTVRHFLGLAHQRAPWPETLDLPRLGWVLLLDGLDESPLTSGEAARVLEALGDHTTLLVTCRLDDHRRYVDAGSSTFEVYVDLDPWRDEHLERYAQALDASGRSPAAEAVRRLMALQRGPKVISYPLWLTMLVYLATESGGIDVETLDDYQLVHRTMGAFATSEITRQGGRREDAGALEAAWRRTAWLLHERRRARQGPLSASRLAQELGCAPEDPVFQATRSLLDVDDELVKGFRHEVFHDYWLGEHIAEKLPEASGVEVAEVLGLQRRPFANDVIGHRLEREGRGTEAAEMLRLRFDEIPAGPTADFVKNQMLYFLGRLDASDATRQFLGRLWRSDAGEFVRYSAAFTGAMIEAPGVEEEYYAQLTQDERSDALNRGYHLFYHGDVDVLESEMPYCDPGAGSAEQAIRILIDRLTLTEPRNRRLRRIELLTLRRFLETRGPPAPELVTAMEGVLTGVETEASDDDQWGESIRGEIAGIREAASL